jgi:hypothetical protein
MAWPAPPNVINTAGGGSFGKHHGLLALAVAGLCFVALTLVDDGGTRGGGGAGGGLAAEATRTSPFDVVASAAAAGRTQVLNLTPDASLQVGLALPGVSGWLLVDHPGCHQLDVFRLQNNVVGKGANPTRRISPSPAMKTLRLFPEEEEEGERERARCPRATASGSAS